MKRSIARRLLVGLTATVGLTSALFVLLLAIYETREGEKDLRADIESSVSAFAQMIEPTLWDIDSARSARIAEAFARDPRIARLTVHDGSNGLVQTFTPKPSADTALRTRQVRRGNTVLGDVSVAFDRGYYRSIMLQQLAGAVVVTLIALVATLVALNLLFRRLLRRPLRELSDVVRQYASGEYDSPRRSIPFVEFAELERVLGAMSAQIRQQFAALDQANRELRALNQFLKIASTDTDPRELVAEAARELKDHFSACTVRAEIISEHGVSESVVVERGRSPAETSAQVALQVPILVNGAAAGSIILRRESERPFTEGEVALAAAVASQAAVAIARYRARSAERLLRAAIEQLPESVVITDADMRAVFVNPAFTATTGFTPEDVAGQIPRILKRAADDDPNDNAVLRRVAAAETFMGRLRSRKKSGEVFFEHSIITPVRDERGEITHFVSVSRDVTAEMQRDERYRHAQRMDAIGQLAGGVAHDFNNMLGVVLMQLDLLEPELRLTPHQSEGMQNMRDALMRAANLTRQLLMFSRRQAMRVQEHDLNTIVEQMLRILRHVIGERIDVEFEPANTPVPFEGDAGMIEQVLVNLCVNARDAMPKGGQLTISTGVSIHGSGSEHPGRWVCLTVRDTGTGMSEETKSRIFEPFFTTKEVGHGTGLGLATTHGIVSQHGGWIDVESTLGAGTLFQVYLPALDHAAIPQPESQPRAIRDGNAKLLVVEDEDVVRKMLVTSLSGLGYSVVEAISGPDALQRWESSARDVDLVLTDMVMPGGISGVELVDTLRRSRPELPAIVMSGYSLQLADHSLPEDIDFLPKPFSVSALSKAVDEALR